MYFSTKNIASQKSRKPSFPPLERKKKREENIAAKTKKGSKSYPIRLGMFSIFVQTWRQTFLSTEDITF